MRKSKLVLLAVAAAVALSAPAMSADKASVGLNWGFGPVMVFGPFDMKMDNAFSVGWKVSDNFSVGVIREDGTIRGEHSYTDDRPAQNNVKRTVIVNGTSNLTAIRFMTNLALPIFSLGLGIDMGSEAFVSAATYSTSDGSVGTTTIADFGNNVAALNATAAVLGLAAKVNLLEMETKTVTTSVDISCGARYVSFNDRYVFGSQETSTTKVPRKKIDAVKSFSNLTLMAGVGIWF